MCWRLLSECSVCTLARLACPLPGDSPALLVDAASRYGTWVNSTRLEKGTSVAVGEGDALQFGHHSHAQLQPVPVRLHLLPSAQVDTTELASELGTHPPCQRACMT